ncbi:type II toxin-antitoxin system Phd/YefM family antitoxin [Tsukamurella sp. NPDC003166]|uniref:type II toxin-antitoxin system Phd/YefM family antitoxin n=1 Tax=Tsukamurella sp. NPDC003166 TaxID=3154444 RepID=UPI0033A3672D
MTTTADHPEVPIAELRSSLGDTVARTAYTNERVIITRHGKPAAALISADDLAYFERLEDAADAALLREAIRADDGYRISGDTLLAALDAEDAESE